MACSLGILCEPLKALGLHSHRSAAKRSTKKTSRKPARSTRSTTRSTRSKKRK